MHERPDPLYRLHAVEHFYVVQADPLGPHDIAALVQIVILKIGVNIDREIVGRPAFHVAQVIALEAHARIKVPAPGQEPVKIDFGIHKPKLAHLANLLFDMRKRRGQFGSPHSVVTRQKANIIALVQEVPQHQIDQGANFIEGQRRPLFKLQLAKVGLAPLAPLEIVHALAGGIRPLLQCIGRAPPPLRMKQNLIAVLGGQGARGCVHFGFTTHKAAGRSGCEPGWPAPFPSSGCLARRSR